jgi:hypothetical protein
MHIVGVVEWSTHDWLEQEPGLRAKGDFSLI